MINKGEFKKLLGKLYKEDPCRVLPNAIWKTNDTLDSFKCSYMYEDGELLKLEGWDKNGLYIFWNKNRKIDKFFLKRMKQSNFMMIHNDYFRQINTDKYSLVKPFFRIMHNNKEVLTYSLSKDFYISESHIYNEFSQISDFIRKCYKDLHPSSDTVRSWTTHKVFDKNLWIWIMDKHKNIPVALGIAEFDESVPEGSLEWIQVLPEYQGKGLGKVLVLELLNRLKGRVKFTTVSGEVDNETNPERLYRSCGFYGKDIWWLLQK